MPLKIKVDTNSIRFGAVSIFTTCLHGLFCSNGGEVLVLLIVYAATLLNTALLTHMVRKMFNVHGRRMSKSYMVFIGCGKFLLLLGAVTLGVHLVGNRVMIAVSNYVIQLFIVGMFLRRRYLK